MSKKVILAVVVLLLIVGTIGAVKGAQIAALIESGKNATQPPTTVTAGDAKSAQWQDEYTAVGTVVALKGVALTAELPGVVRKIRFESGQAVKKGQLLLLLDTGVERAQLASARAQRELAKIQLKRTTKLTTSGVVAKAQLDSAKAQAKQTSAQLSNVRAVLGKKAVTAPFSGRLGIREVDVGEYLTPGAPIVTLQDLTSVYVDFRQPQRALAVVSNSELEIEVTTDAFGKRKWTGKVHAIESAIDTTTRNVRVRAKFDNKDEALKAGMFVDVRLRLPTKKNVVVIPGTAVQYAPYGDSVFVVADPKDAKESDDKGGKIAKQVFVRLGERRGDLVAVESGLKAGQTIVTSGGFKLKNGGSIVIDNELAPDARGAPEPEDK